MLAKLYVNSTRLSAKELRECLGKEPPGHAPMTRIMQEVFKVV